MSECHATHVPPTVIKGKQLRQSKSDVDLRVASMAALKPIHVRQDTVTVKAEPSSSMPKPLFYKEYNLVLLGQASVGKSEMIYEMMADVDDDAALLRIFDTANTTEPVHLTDGQGFLILYSIDNRLSFETAKQLVKMTKEFKRYRRTTPSIVLVGNKLDLEHLRVVSKREGRTFAIRNDCSFFETSAMDDVNILTAFHETVRQIRYASKRFPLKRMNSLTKFFSR